MSGFSFSPAAQTPGGFSFGTPVQPTTGGFNFGTPSPAGLANAATSGTGVSNSGATTSTTSTVHPSNLTGGFTFGQGGSTTAATTTTTNPATTTTAATPATSGGFSFGSLSTTGTQPSLTNPLSTTSSMAPTHSSQPPLGGLSSGITFTNPTVPGQTTAASTANPAAPSTSITATPTKPAEITKSTKFEDLPEQYREQIIKIERMIKKERQGSEALVQHSNQQIKEVKQKIEKIQQKMTSIKISLEKDTTNIGALRFEVFQALKNAELAGRIFERLKNPNSTTLLPGSYQVSTSEYFLNLVSSYETKMQTYKQVIEELDRILTSFLDHTPTHPQVVVEIIKSQHESFLSIASHVAFLHQGVKELKETYLDYRLKYFGESRNPFAPPEKKKKIAPAPIVATPAQPQPQQNAFASPFGTGLGGASPGTTTRTGTGTGFGTGGFGYGTTTTPSTFGAPTSAGTTAPTLGGFGTTFGFGGTNPATPTPAPTLSLTSTAPSTTLPSLSLVTTPQPTLSGQAGLLFPTSESKKKKK